MNKTLSIILCFLLLFGHVGAVASEDTNAPLDEAIWNVKSAGLMEGYEDGGFYPEKEINRGEFSAVVSRVCGITSEICRIKTVFSDVTDSHWASGYINAAYNLRLINGYEDGTFRADEFLTHEQCLKILVCALGYSQKAIDLGGYPTGYYATAVGLGICDGVAADLKSTVHRGEVAMYLYNALEVRPLEMKYTDAADTYAVSDKTLSEKLASYRGTNQIEGVVTSNGITALSGESTIGKDEVIIDGKRYKTGSTNAADYLGCRVAVYVTDSTSKVPTIASVRSVMNADDILTVDAENVENINKSELVYFKDNGKSGKVSLSYVKNYLYNGKAVSSSTVTDSFLEIHNGKYTFADGDDDGKFETLMIEEYESLVADRIYAYGKTIYFANEETYKGKSGLKINSDDDDYVYDIQHSDGSSAVFEDITEGCVVTLSASTDLKVCKIIISDKKVTGKITQINTDGNEIYVDEQMYKLATKADGSVGFTPVLGAEATFLIDCFGNVAATDGKNLTNENYAYVINTKPANFSENAMLKLVGSGTHEKIIKKDDNTEEIYHDYRNGNAEIAELASRVVLNGNAVDSDNINLSDLRSCIIGYKVNEDGKISKINTYAHRSEKFDLLFNAELMSFGGYTNSKCFFAGSGTQVICVPQIADSDEDYLEILRLSDNGQYSCLPVNIDDATQTAEAVLIFGDMDADTEKPIDAETGVSIVGSVSSFIDDNGAEKVKIEVLTGDKLTNEICKDDALLVSKARKLRKGDLIRYSLNVDGEIDKIEKKASIQGLTKYYNANRNSPSEEIYAMASSVKLNRLSPVENEIVDELVLMLGEDESAPCVEYNISHKEAPEIYLYERRNGNIYTGSGYDIETFENVGNGASKIFMIVQSNVPEVIVIIND